MKKGIMLTTVETSTNGDDEDKNGVRKGEKGYRKKCWYKLPKNTVQVLPNQLADRLEGFGYFEITG